jgi:hypothetical protein
VGGAQTDIDETQRRARFDLWQIASRRRRLVTGVCVGGVLAVTLGMSGSFTASADASVVSNNVAYVFDESLFPCESGCGMNDTSFPGGSLFTNALGFQPGSGEHGSYTPAGGTAVNLTNVTLGTLNADPHALDGFDTAILYQTCNIGMPENVAAMAEINAFLEAGRKVMIFDGDGCSPSASSRGGTPDWSGFAVPFETDNPGPQGAPGAYSEVESSPLTAGLFAGPVEGDAVGDANIFTSFDSRWFQAIAATNVNGATGRVEAYAKTSAGGLAIYSGEDFWYTDGPSAHLQTVFDDILGQPWNPDNLPSTARVVGGGPVSSCTREATVVGIVGVCADRLTRTGNTVTGTGNVTLDNGVSVGDGPVVIDPGAAQITTPPQAPIALLRSGGPVPLGNASVTVATGATSDPTSGKSELAKLTLNSVSFGPLGNLRVGGLPISLPSGDGLTLYLDGSEGGGVVGTGSVQLPKLGGAAPSGAASLGFYAATPSPVVFLGGTLHLGRVSLAPGWAFAGLDLGYQKSTDTWTASSGLEAPIGSLQASGSVSQGRLDSLQVHIGGQDVPLADSGFFFSGFGGGFSGLANGPLKINASTEGYWGVPKAPVEPFYLDNVTVTVSLAGSVSFDGAVSFALKDHSPVHGQLHLKLGLHPFVASGSASAEGQLPEVSLKAGGGIGFSTKHFTAIENGSVKVFALSGGGQVILSDAGVGASGVLCGPFHFCQSIGFTETWKQLSNFDLPTIVGADPQRLITVKGIAAAGQSAGFRVPPGRRILLASISGTAGAPEVRLRAPDGRTFSSARSTTTAIFTRQAQFGLTTVTVIRPRAGVWRIMNAPGQHLLRIRTETVGSIRLIRAAGISPSSSARRPLSARARIRVRWSSAGLPKGVRVVIVRLSLPHEAGVGIVGNLDASGSYVVPVKKLAPGRNYLKLAATLNGVPFQEVALGSAWRAKPRSSPRRSHRKTK